MAGFCLSAGVSLGLNIGPNESCASMANLSP
jgi:hypothetical protein